METGKNRCGFFENGNRLLSTDRRTINPYSFIPYSRIRKIQVQPDPSTTLGMTCIC